MKKTPLTIYVPKFGEAKTLSQWAADDRIEATAEGIRGRLRSGWDPADAVTMSVGGSPAFCKKRIAGKKAKAEAKIKRKVERQAALEESVDNVILAIGADPKDEKLRQHVQMASRQYRCLLTAGDFAGRPYESYQLRFLCEQMAEVIEALAGSSPRDFQQQVGEVLKRWAVIKVDSP